MKTLKAWLRAQLNDRLIISLKILGLSLLFVVYFEVRDSAELATAQAKRVQGQAASLTAVDAEAIWVSRAKAALSAKSDWQGSTWSAPTSGVAAAEIQALLEKLGKDSDFNRIAARVEPTPIEIDGQAVLRFDVTATAEPPAALFFLSQLSLYLPRLITTDLSASFSDRASSFRLSGIAPFHVEAPAETENAG